MVPHMSDPGDKLRTVAAEWNTCSASGCENRSHRRGSKLCSKHYTRMRKHGTLDIPNPKYPSRGVCTVDGCENDARTKRLCVKHYKRLARYGDPVFVPKLGKQGPEHPNWLGDIVGYYGAHHRVNRARGRAREHACADCGRPATEWSYNHDDPNEQLACDERRNRPRAMPMAYSTDPAHYSPRCQSCHIAFDRQHCTI